MKRCSILFLVILISCQSKNNQSNLNDSSFLPKKNLSFDIPAEVKNYLSKEFEDWKIPDTSDYIKNWESFYEKKQLPYFVSGDFNGDKQTDYAIMIIKSKSIRLVFLLRSANSFNKWIAKDFVKDFEEPIRDIDYGINLEQPGVINGFDNNTLNLKNQGVTLSKFETSSKLYYWENGEFKVFWTGD